VRRNRLGILAAAIIAVGVWGCCSADAGESRIIDAEAYLLYVPADIDEQGLHPLVIVFSPGGDSRRMIDVWKDTAERYKWMVLASKEFRNGIDADPVLRRLADSVDAVRSQFPVDPSKIIASGFSGGGMGAHIFAFSYPSLISAVIVNTGMINEAYIQRRQDYPRGKYAVFLASPKDFRYEEMRRDERFLKELGWRTFWVEFDYGHAIAPASAYESAAQWLSEQLKNSRRPGSGVNSDKVRVLF
jgi:predicted esterase